MPFYKGGKMMEKIVKLTCMILTVFNIILVQCFAEDIINGCYGNMFGRLRIVESDNACRSHETALQWNATGPQGIQGLQGEQGTQGLPGSARAYAWVAADGTVITHGGASTITITKVGTGQYCIETDPNILGTYDVIIATLQGSDSSFGFISANSGWGSVCNPHGGHGVFTANTAGTATDRAFGVMIP